MVNGTAAPGLAKGIPPWPRGCALTATAFLPVA